MVSIFIYGIIEGLLIALVALSFQLSYSGLKMFDIGIGGLYVAASYIYIGASKNLFVNSTSFEAILLSSILAVLGVVGLTLLIERLIYRPFFRKKASELTLLLVSLSVYTIIVNIVATISGVETSIISLGFDGKVEITGVIITYIQIVQVFVSLMAIIVVYLILSKTLIGKKVTAISENLRLFKVLGFDENYVRQVILIVSGILITIASILKTADTGIAPFSHGFHIVLLAAVAVIVGGIKSYKGAIVGSLILGLVMNIVAFYFLGNWKEAATFGLLVIVLLLKRDGLFYTKLRPES